MYKKLRIFLASPGDVTAERDRVHAVANELNRTGNVADQLGLTLEVLDWRTHVAPYMGRPEDVVLQQLPVESWDVLIGILWLRFGTPTGAIDPNTGLAFDSGTEEEFTLAYHSWKQNRRPQILFYRCARPADLNRIDPDQFKKVKACFADFDADRKHPGLYQTFETTEDFERRLRQDLTNLLYKFGGEALKKTPPASVAKPQASRESSEALQRRYLQKLQTYCNLLPLAAIAEERDRHSSARLTLSQVYIGLNTTDLIDKTGRPVTMESREMARSFERSQREELRPLSALEAAARHPALVILGDPGSGKTSFLNHLMFILAAKHLPPESALPKDWPHGSLLPVRVLLHELAISLENKEARNFLNKGREDRQRGLSRLVHEHIADHLVDYDAPDFSEALRQTIADGRCLVVFDGLDEAPPSRRELVRLAVEDFCATNPGNRYLVTCRSRSYEGPACLQSFKTATLAPFDDKQVSAFAEGWYDALVQIEQFRPEQAAAKKDDLKQAVRRLPQDLVRNPLLLTTMANVHANNVELPRQRVKLYQKASALLLRRWQEQKAGKISLFEEIGLQSDKEIYKALWELGYQAQKAERGQEAADILETDAVSILARHFSSVPEPLVAAGRFLGFVDQTAGLLIGRGGARGNVYAFPHRTFQEYFAGCHLAKGSRDFKRELLGLLAEGDYWRLTAQLGVEELLHNDNHDGPALDAAYFLCPEQQPSLSDAPAWRGVLWAAHFALEIGPSRIEADNVIGGGVEFLRRLRQRLVTILEKEECLLPARERVEAGFVLGKLGDPRDGVCSLPPVWVELAGGRFIMGDKEYGPPHDVELSPFKISKYPITNAQYAEFVNTGGYREKKWWSDDGWKYRQKEKWEQPRWWDNEEFNLPNQPVVGVSWFEAEAFCRWLTEQMAVGKYASEQVASGKKFIVQLPTEAEWEFAARGKEGRQYPWGKDEPIPEHANYDALNLRRPTAVGSFPQGATPEEIFDLAGNVWEWCLDWYGEKYYAECKERGVEKDPPGPETGVYRVLRGASWWDVAADLRGSQRDRNIPDGRNGNNGFRVCGVGGS